MTSPNQYHTTIWLYDAQTELPIPYAWTQIYTVNYRGTSFGKTSVSGKLGPLMVTADNEGEWQISVAGYAMGSLNVAFGADSSHSLHLFSEGYIPSEPTPELAGVRIIAYKEGTELPIVGASIRLTASGYAQTLYANVDGEAYFTDVPVGFGDVLVMAEGFTSKTEHMQIIAPSTLNFVYLEESAPETPPDTLPAEGVLEIQSISPISIPNGIYHEGSPIEILATIRNDTTAMKEVRIKMRSMGGKVLDTEPDMFWKNIPAQGGVVISVAFASIIPQGFENEYIAVELWEQHTGKADTKYVVVGAPEYEPEKPPDTGYGGLIIAVGLGAAIAYVLGANLK